MPDNDNNDISREILNRLTRIADALERSAPAVADSCDLSQTDAFIWQAERAHLLPVEHVNRIELSLLQGIDHVRDILMQNTKRFANGLPANNALLWGARGMGKSSPARS